MQPRASRLTESEALTDFNHLWGSVEEWVVTNLGDAIEAIQLGTAKPSYSAGARRLLLLVPAPGREAYAYENTDEHNVMATIMRFLCDQAFDRDFYCNIEEGGSNFLKTIETSMRNLEPRRGMIWNHAAAFVHTLTLSRCYHLSNMESRNLASHHQPPYICRISSKVQ